MKKLFVGCQRDQQHRSFKTGYYIGIEDLLNCAPTFLFFYWVKLNAFHITQTETP